MQEEDAALVGVLSPSSTCCCLRTCPPAFQMPASSWLADAAATTELKRCTALRRPPRSTPLFGYASAAAQSPNSSWGECRWTVETSCAPPALAPSTPSVQVFSWLVFFAGLWLRLVGFIDQGVERTLQHSQIVHKQPRHSCPSRFWLISSLRHLCRSLELGRLTSSSSWLGARENLVRWCKRIRRPRNG